MTILWYVFKALFVKTAPKLGPVAPPGYKPPRTPGKPFTPGKDLITGETASQKADRLTKNTIDSVRERKVVSGPPPVKGFTGGAGVPPPSQKKKINLPR